MSPSPTSLPSFAAPNRVEVDTVPPVPVLALSDLTAVMPSIPDYVAAQVEAARTDPVLCIQPMTAGDARYAEGRRAGLREAAALLRDGASLLRGGGLLSRAVADGLRQVAERTEAKAGEP